MYLVLWVLLIIAHSLYDLYIFIKQQCKWLRLAVEKRGYFSQINHKYSYLSSNSRLASVSKIPRHLAILIGQEKISIPDLVNLISWCIVAEIPYVSFYDHKGILHENQDLLRRKIDELEPPIRQSIQWSDSSNSPTNNISITETNKNIRNIAIANIMHTNATEVLNKSKTKIQVLSYTDGKRKIITLTKNLAKIVHLNGLHENNVTSELLDEKLNFDVRMPDPDLAIVFGKAMCTFGFLPWQTRVTEFFMPTHQDISSKDFIDILVRYSECQQRYGK